MKILNLYAGIGGNRKLYSGNLMACMIYSYICGQGNINNALSVRIQKRPIRDLVCVFRAMTKGVIELMQKVELHKLSIATTTEKKSGRAIVDTTKKIGNNYSTYLVTSVSGVGLMI